MENSISNFHFVFQNPSLTSSEQVTDSAIMTFWCVYILLSEKAAKKMRSTSMFMKMVINVYENNYRQ